MGARFRTPDSGLDIDMVSLSSHCFSQFDEFEFVSLYLTSYLPWAWPLAERPTYEGVKADSPTNQRDGSASGSHQLPLR